MTGRAFRADEIGPNHSLAVTGRKSMKRSQSGCYEQTQQGNQRRQYWYIDEFGKAVP
jgi:hypothetical protein